MQATVCDDDDTDQAGTVSAGEVVGNKKPVNYSSAVAPRFRQNMIRNFGVT